VDRIYWLSQIENSDKSLVGERIFILSQLLNYGYPVLPGLVVDRTWLSHLLATSREYLALTNNQSDYFLHLNIDDDRALQAIARQSRKIIETLVLPPESETLLFNAASKFDSPAVILEPYFFTETGKVLSPPMLRQARVCWLDKTTLSEGLKQVWSRLFTAQSIFYWHKLGISVDRLNYAVSIKPLQSAIATGTLQIEAETMTIEAIWGLEFSLWQGEVEPDKYIIDRQQKTILQKYRGYQEQAYRLDDNPPFSLSSKAIESYIIDEPENETWILETEAISILIELTRNLLKERANLTSFSWSWLQVEPEIFSQPQFYITYLDENSSFDVEKVNDNTLSLRPLLTGMAAATGRVFAEVIISPNLNLPASAIPTGSILVTKTIPPDKIFLLKQLGGIITETGGMTSHGAIVARELGIPAIVGATDAMRILQHETKILLDGNLGGVYRQNIELESQGKVDRPLIWHETIATQLMVNLSNPQQIDRLASLPIDGVGLLRSDILLNELLASQSRHIWQEALPKLHFIATAKDLLRQFAAAFAPRPIFYRSLDWQEANSTRFSNRGTYSYLADPTLFDLELSVLAELTADGYGNINLILPFVRSVAEFEFCLGRVTKFGLTANPAFQLWIMAEVPSVIFLLPEYIRAGVQGIAIGTNDLSQLLLGIDRESTDFRLTTNDSALELAIAQLIETAKAHNIPRSICGQAPVQNPKLIDKLIEWGITTISVEPDSIINTQRAIARAEKRLLLKSINSL
jgi:pyruvate,water dikinase